jgi:hypothetical protein
LLPRHARPEAATVFYATDDFGGRGVVPDMAQMQARLIERLSRARPKDLAHDYLQREEVPTAPAVDAAAMLEETRAVARRQRLAEREIEKG